MTRMTNQMILDTIYLLPAILDCMEKPDKNKAAILKQFGIDSNQFKDLMEIKTLIQYHVAVVQSNFQSFYPLLRQGLAEYFNKYLSTMFKDLNLVNKEADVLDYGCGNGRVSDQFLVDNPGSKITLIDKDDSGHEGILKIDFEKDPLFYEFFENSFDYIILSEVLHCKDVKGQRYILDSCKAMLRDEGTLIIIENVDHCMEYRMKKIKNDETIQVLDPTAIRKLTWGDSMENNLGFLLMDSRSYYRHTIYLYAKV